MTEAKRRADQLNEALLGVHGAQGGGEGATNADGGYDWEPGMTQPKTVEEDEVPPGWVDDDLWDAVPPIQFDEGPDDRRPPQPKRGQRRRQ